MSNGSEGIAEYPASERRLAEYKRWHDRLHDFATPLTDTDWEHLREELREEATHHRHMVPAYSSVDKCPHNIPEEVLEGGEDDGIHFYDLNETGLYCRETPDGEVCICDEAWESCRYENDTRQAQEDLWSSVSAAYAEYRSEGGDRG